MSATNNTDAAMGHVKSKGYLTLEELRQIGEELPGAISLVALAIQKPAKETREAIARKEVAAEACLPVLSDALDTIRKARRRLWSAILAAQIESLAEAIGPVSRCAQAHEPPGPGQGP